MSTLDLRPSGDAVAIVLVAAVYVCVQVSMLAHADAEEQSPRFVAVVSVSLMTLNGSGDARSVVRAVVEYCVRPPGVLVVFVGLPSNGP